MIEGLGVFIAMALVDFIWAKYTVAVTKGAAVYSSVLAGGIVGCNALVTLGYVHDVWLLIPAVLGAIAGTYIAVKFR